MTYETSAAKAEPHREAHFGTTSQLAEKLIVKDTSRLWSWRRPSPGGATETGLNPSRRRSSAPHQFHRITAPPSKTTQGRAAAKAKTFAAHFLPRQSMPAPHVE
jgi:hypothetical protein